MHPKNVENLSPSTDDGQQNGEGCQGFPVEGQIGEGCQRFPVEEGQNGEGCQGFPVDKQNGEG